MTRTASPTITKLDDQTCRLILARNHVGRIAYARANQLEVEPIHYVYSDGWIFGRTSHGAKADMIGAGWWPVAFEVDETEHLFRWRSVIVHGGFYVLSPTAAKAEVALWQTALELLRSLVPETLTDSDPVPNRSIVFGISVQEISGRAATSTPENGRPPSEVVARARGPVAPFGARRECSSKPVALLGERSALSRKVRSILNAAGYRVIDAGSCDELIALAGQREPRVIVVLAEGSEEWKRLLPTSDALSPISVPMIVVSAMDALPIEGVTGVVSVQGGREEPSFARRILDEVRFAEQRSDAPSLRHVPY